MKKVLSAIGTFLRKSSEDSLPAYAAQATFFVLLSFFPFVILLILLSSRLSFANTDMALQILDFAPSQLSDYIQYVINDITYSNTTSFTVVTIIVTLWSSAKGMQTLAVALDKIYKVEKRKNFILLRVLCSLYTFVFMLLLILIMAAHVFAGPIAHEITSHFPEYINEAAFIISLKGVITFLVIFIFLLLSAPRPKGRNASRVHRRGYRCAALDAHDEGILPLHSKSGSQVYHVRESDIHDPDHHLAVSRYADHALRRRDQLFHDGVYQQTIPQETGKKTSEA